MADKKRNQATKKAANGRRTKAKSQEQDSELETPQPDQPHPTEVEQQEQEQRKDDRQSPEQPQQRPDEQPEQPSEVSRHVSQGGRSFRADVFVTNQYLMEEQRRAELDKQREAHNHRTGDVSLVS